MGIWHGLTQKKERPTHFTARISPGLFKSFEAFQIIMLKSSVFEGASNSYVGDLDYDGDLDLFRYDGHDGKSYELWLNNTIETKKN